MNIYIFLSLKTKYFQYISLKKKVIERSNSKHKMTTRGIAKSQRRFSNMLRLEFDFILYVKSPSTFLLLLCQIVLINIIFGSFDANISLLYCFVQVTRQLLGLYKNIFVLFLLLTMGKKVLGIRT